MGGGQITEQGWPIFDQTGQRLGPLKKEPQAPSMIGKTEDALKTLSYGAWPDELCECLVNLLIINANNMGNALAVAAVCGVWRLRA